MGSVTYIQRTTVCSGQASARHLRPIGLAHAQNMVEVNLTTPLRQINFRVENGNLQVRNKSLNQTSCALMTILTQSNGYCIKINQFRQI